MKMKKTLRVQDSGHICYKWMCHNVNCVSWESHKAVEAEEEEEVKKKLESL